MMAGMDTMTERDHTVRALWAEINRIARGTEDETTIRNLIAEAGIPAGVHVGDDPESFEDNPTKLGEYVLGQWRAIVESGATYALNTARNMSLRFYEQAYG